MGLSRRVGFMPHYYRNKSKTGSTPRRPYEKERIDRELKLIGEYGLKNKKEVWRISKQLSKIRSAARELLTLDRNDPKRLFEGSALLKRLVRLGVLDEDKQDLNFCLNLQIPAFLDRRLQTVVWKIGLARSVHHARVLIRQRHIRVGKQIVNASSYYVRKESEKHIEFSQTSPFGSGRPGRNARKKAKSGGGDGGDDD